MRMMNIFLHLKTQEMATWFNVKDAHLIWYASLCCRIHFNWITSEKSTEHAKNNNQRWFNQLHLIDSLGL